MPEARKVTFGLPQFEDLLDRAGENGTGIPLPAERDGSVILILGPPGSGKSMLALQMAWGCNVADVPVNTLYFALEQSGSDLMKLARNMGWPGDVPDEDSRIWRLDVDPTERDRIGARNDLGRWYELVCLGAPGKEAGTIILPSVTPRRSSLSTRSDGSLFSSRLEDIHLLLDGYLRCQARNTGSNVSSPWCYRTVCEGTCSCSRKTPPDNVCFPLGLVVIDSLNVFAEEEITRDQVFALSDLFVRHGTIGILIGEDYQDADDGKSSRRFKAAEYVADVVIRLQNHREQGYLITTIEIAKSRDQLQVLGEHPYKIVRHGLLPRTSWATEAPTSPQVETESGAPEPLVPAAEPLAPRSDSSVRRGEPTRDKGAHSSTEVEQLAIGKGSSAGTVVSTPSGITPGDTFTTGLLVFRSLHRQLSHNLLPRPWKGKLSLGSSIIDCRLPSSMTEGRWVLRQAPVTVLEGQFGTYKSAFALNFLLRGVCDGSNGLLLSLQESVPEDVRDYPIFPELKSDLEGLVLADPESSQELGGYGKIQRTQYFFHDPRDEAWRELSILSFRPGNLLAEEFIEAMLEEINRLSPHGVDGPEERLRIVLDDTSEIPSRFPLLAESRTAGKIFLPAVVDVVRGQGPIPLLITTGLDKEGYSPQTDLTTLADVILRSSRVSLYGRERIVLTLSMRGARQPQAAGSPMELSTRGTTIQATRAGSEFPVILEVDESRLEGIVGLETGSPGRADLGLSLYVETQSKLDEAKRIEWCSRALLGQDVRIKYFSPKTAESLYEAWLMWEDLPLRTTEVLMFDEFCKTHILQKEPDDTPARGLAVLDDLVKKKFGDQRVAELFRPGLLPAQAGDGSAANRIFGLPYYSNVLLLAWNEEALRTEYGETEPWAGAKLGHRAPATLWQDMLKHKVRFDYDRRAVESHVCLFLELLGAKMVPLKKWLAGDGSFDVEQCLEHFESFSELLQLNGPVWSRAVNGSAANQAPWEDACGDRSTAANGRQEYRKPELCEIRKNRADPDAHVWCHWYTTLCDMFSERPELASKVRVAGLPAGGFKGDWYLGMAAGSVSLETGWKAILQLCAKSRDAEKVDSGLGLPVWRALYDDREIKAGPAWPGSQQTLAEIGDIWEGAQNRSDIKEYIQLDGIFRTAFFEIVGDRKCRPPARRRDTIKEVLHRMRARARYILAP